MIPDHFLFAQLKSCAIRENSDLSNRKSNASSKLNLQCGLLTRAVFLFFANPNGRIANVLSSHFADIETNQEMLLTGGIHNA